MFALPPADEPKVTATPPSTSALPDAVRALFDAAGKSSDPAAFAAVARLARQTNPASAPQIEALVAENDARIAEAKARAAREKADALAQASFLDLWKGEVELGASRATGNSNNLGAYGSVKLVREGLKWRHKLNGRIDYQRTDGETSTERANLAFQPEYKVDDRLFAYGLGQYEHDRFLGIDGRATLGGGIGYTVVTTPKLKIDLSGGPAVRRTDFYDRASRTTVAGRGSVDARWKLSPTLTLAQTAAVFIESQDSNATATTSLDTKLIGALKARFSYNLTYESDPPDGRGSLDTLSRATLVYSF